MLTFFCLRNFPDKPVMSLQYTSLNTILHRSLTHFQSPQIHLSNTFLDFFKDKIDHIRTKFLPSFPDPFFLHLPRLQRWSILFQPLSLKFTNSFLLLKVNIPWIPSQLSFWNSASMNSIITILVNLSLGSFPSPLTVYPDFDSCYFHFMPYRMTPSVRHRAIEVHYYYYYYVLNWKLNWTDTSLRYITATVRLLQASLYDIQTSYFTQVPSPSLNSVEIAFPP